MKIRRSIPIVGAATRPGDRSAGNWWRNGCGTHRPRTGASVGADSHTHHRICSCHPAAERAGCHASGFISACVWIWSAHHGHPPRKTGRFSGQDFPLQPDGTLRCPAGKPLHPHERRREVGGSLRVVYGASIRKCRPCPLREQCQWQGPATAKPRQVSVLLHPLQVGSASLLFRDWSRRAHRRACMQLVRQQRIEVSLPPPAAASPGRADMILSRARRAHSRLSWAERLARNARSEASGQVTIKLFGIPEDYALVDWPQAGLTRALPISSRNPLKTALALSYNSRSTGRHLSAHHTARKHESRCLPLKLSG
jgi:hypothetical protein